MPETFGVGLRSIDIDELEDAINFVIPMVGGDSYAREWLSDKLDCDI